MKRRATRLLPANLAADYDRVAGAAAAELAARRLCLEAERGGICHLDAGHKPPHLARTPEKTERPDGTIIRTIVEWR